MKTTVTIELTIRTTRIVETPSISLAVADVIRVAPRHLIAWDWEVLRFSAGGDKESKKL